MSDCLFCRIASKEMPAKIVYEDDDVIAFRDITPQAPTHILIIPRKHISSNLDITDTDAGLVGKLFIVANRLAKEEGVDAGGFRTLFNCGADAGQAVFHLHLHLLGGRKMSWPPG